MLAPADLIIEAAVEKLEVKRALFARLEAIVDPTALLASNTSSLSITALAGGAGPPRTLAGMHFFNPAPLMPLVEVVSGVATDAEVGDGLLRRRARLGQDARPCALDARLHRQSRARDRSTARRCASCRKVPPTPATIDAVMREAGGFRMGPFELMDLIGHDVNFAVTRSMYTSYFNDPRYLPSILQQELVAAGRLGGSPDAASMTIAKARRRRRLQRRRKRRRRAASRFVASSGLRRLSSGLSERAGLSLRAARVTEPSSSTGSRSRSAMGAARPSGQQIRAPTSSCCSTSRSTTGRRRASPSRPPSRRVPARRSWRVGFFQALGKHVSVIGDVPGLIVLRTVCLLVNEAADAVNQGVCSVRDLDTAMQIGVNYPRGPLAWADALGPAFMLAVTTNLARSYGEDRYRPSPLLRRRVQTGGQFHEVDRA